MRIAIHTIGTRGDVQPYVALALALKTRGHEVQIAAPAQHAALVAAHGIDFFPLPGDLLALLETPRGKAAVAERHGFSAGFKLLKQIRPLIGRVMDEEWSAAQAFAPDLIIYQPKSLAAPHIAAALAVPCVLASPLPGFTATSAFPSPIVPFASLGPLNRASHVLMTSAPKLLFGRFIRKWREQTLRTVKPPASRVGTLYAYSRHVIPVPKDWPNDVCVSGYWFLDEPEWPPPPELAAFLDAGEPPVYFGFGSMPAIEPERLAQAAVTALARLSKRGILATGSGALGRVEAPNVFTLSDAPHAHLFPRMSAIVHHGGAGTTAAALRAGKPTAVCTFFGDQPFWGRRVAALGAGPPAISQREASAEALASALAAMDRREMRARAACIGEHIRREHGTATAVEFLEHIGVLPQES